MTTKQHSFWNYLFVALIGLAATGAINKYFISGDYAFGVSPDVPWGALIAGYVFFAVAATGTGIVSSLGSVFRIKKLEVLSKRALLASILLLLAAFIVLAIELSNPFKLIWLLFTPNLASPIFWMGAFYGVYLILMFAELFFSLRNNQKATTGIAFVSFFVKIGAVINLGRVFGHFATRDFWYGYYYPAYMVVTAVVSGAAVLLLVSYFMNKEKLLVKDQSVFPTLGRILALALLVLAGMQFAKISIALSSNNPSISDAVQYLIGGGKAVSFWGLEVGVGIILPLIILFTTKFSRPVSGAYAGGLTMLGLFFSRLDFVHIGQVAPLQIVKDISFVLGWGGLNSYTATWSEWFIILGAVGFVLLVFNILAGKLRLDT